LYKRISFGIKKACQPGPVIFMIIKMTAAKKIPQWQEWPGEEVCQPGPGSGKGLLCTTVAYSAELSSEPALLAVFAPGGGKI